MNYLDTWFGLEKFLTEEEVLNLIQKLNKNKKVELLENVIQTVPEKTYKDYDIVISVSRPEGEFKTYIGISLPHTKQSLYETYNLENAIKLSKETMSKVIIDGTGYGDDQSPYWSLIIDQEVIYLADDSKTDFADGEGGPVKIVRKLENKEVK